LARVALVEEHLAREVRLLDHVAVDQHQLADAAAHQRLRQRPAQRSAADEQHARVGEALLALLAERREARLAFETAGRIAHAHDASSFQASAASRPSSSSPPSRNGQSALMSLRGGSFISTQWKKRLTDSSSVTPQGGQVAR